MTALHNSAPAPWRRIAAAVTLAAAGTLALTACGSEAEPTGACFQITISPEQPTFTQAAKMTIGEAKRTGEIGPVNDESVQMTANDLDSDIRTLRVAQRGGAVVKVGDSGVACITGPQHNMLTVAADPELQLGF